METIEQLKKRKLRELKLEQILLYEQWEERCREESHWTWEQWLKVRKLRQQSVREQIQRKPYVDTSVYITTSFGARIKQHSWWSAEVFHNHVDRLEYEFRILQDYPTRRLLYVYLHRNRCDGECEPRFEGHTVMYVSIMHVLRTREHIPRKKEKRLHVGKKDKHNVRKNPTNRK